MKGKVHLELCQEIYIASIFIKAVNCFNIICILKKIGALQRILFKTSARRGFGSRLFLIYKPHLIKYSKNTTLV